MPKVSVAQKGTAPDSSDYTAYRRRQAILASQQAKSPPGNPAVKPFFGEYHLQHGFTNGIVQYRFSNGKTLDANRFN